MLCLVVESKEGDEGRVFLGLRPRLFPTVEVGTEERKEGGKGGAGEGGGEEVRGKGMGEGVKE